MHSCTWKPCFATHWHGQELLQVYGRHPAPVFTRDTRGRGASISSYRPTKKYALRDMLGIHGVPGHLLPQLDTLQACSHHALVQVVRRPCLGGVQAQAEELFLTPDAAFHVVPSFSLETPG